MNVGAVRAPTIRRSQIMQSITTIGLDIAKSVFQVHGVDAAGQVVLRRQLKRRYVLKFFEKLPPCLVGIEACASSHQRQIGGKLHPNRGPSGESRLQSTERCHDTTVWWMHGRATCGAAWGVEEPAMWRPLMTCSAAFVAFALTAQLRAETLFDTLGAKPITGFGPISNRVGAYAYANSF